MEAGFDIGPLVEAWRRATDEIKQEVQRMCEAAAATTAERLRAAYPLGPTGNLRRSVMDSLPRGYRAVDGNWLPGRRVLAGHPFAPHIHFIEGCKDGEGRAGKKHVPARPTFVPFAVQERQSYLERAQSYLESRSGELV